MENRNQKTKALVEAGMVSALTVVIALIVIFIGLDTIAAVCIIPIPITVIYVRRGFKYSVGTLLISTILVSMFSNPIQGTANTLILGSVGIFLGYFIQKKYTSYRLLSIMGLVVALAAILHLLIYILLIYKSGINGMINEAIIDPINKSFDIVTKFAGNNKDSLAQLEKMKKIFTKDNILMLLPGMFIVIGYMFAYLNYAITKTVLKRLKHETSEMIQFTKIYIPSIVGMLIFLSYIIGAVLMMNKFAVGGYISMSSQLVLQCVFTLQGMCVFSYFLLNKYNLSKGITAIIVIVPLLFNLSFAFTIVGMIDLIYDFRKVNPNRVIKR